MPFFNENDVFFGGPNSRSIGAFGGESFGFAGDVLARATESFYSSRAVANPLTVANGMNDGIPRSIFNEYALFNYRGLYGGLLGSLPFDNYFDNSNSPNVLHGGFNAHHVSIPKLIEFFNTYYPKIGYKAQDFLYLKHYKNIPVNHIITLRRFPLPVKDNIFDLTAKIGNKEDELKLDSNDATQVAGVTAVTYLGETAGNKLDDILKFSYGLTWKDLESEFEAISSNKSDYRSQPFYSKLGTMGESLADTLKGIKSGEKFRKSISTVDDPLGTTYANFVMGPVNVVDRTYVRDRGIKFENDIKITFEYELKSLNYVNPKIAMIDIISNMLTLTTNNGQFFGGGHRYYGSAGYVADQFGDINLLRNGNFSGYVGSFVDSINTGFENVFGGPSGNFDLESILQGVKKAGGTLLGNLLGGFLNTHVAAVSGANATKAFISGDPTGDLHLTVGNPLNPIIMAGNMISENTIMTLGQGLGYDDFPVEIKFEVDLKHGKPRDKGDIENMFNAGRGRIYASPANTEDILNLRGIDVATYGSVRTGNASLQNTQSGAQVSSIKNEQLSNVSKGLNRSSQSTPSGEYLDNLVSMLIDS